MLKTIAILTFTAHALVIQQNDESKLSCIQTDQLETYKVVNDEQILLKLSSGEKLIMLLAGQCPQLKYQGYWSFTPVDGTLCASRDQIMTRTGETCRIDSLQPLERPLSSQ